MLSVVPIMSFLIFYPQVHDPVRDHIMYLDAISYLLICNVSSAFLCLVRHSHICSLQTSDVGALISSVFSLLTKLGRYLKVRPISYFLPNFPSEGEFPLAILAGIVFTVMGAKW